MEYFEYITNLNYLGWFSIGLIFVLLELVLPGTYLIWFGLSAFMMGIIVHFFVLTATETGVLFALISGGFAALGWFFYRKVINQNKIVEEYKYLNDMAGSYIGKSVNLSEDVVDGRAKAKVGDTFWIVAVDENLSKGDKVKITGVINGVILKAEKNESN